MNPQTAKTKFGKVPVTWLPDRKRWQLSIWKDGKNHRKLFSSKEEASRQWKIHCNRIADFGFASNDYSPSQHLEYQEAKRIVGSHIDLRDVARFFLKMTPAFHGEKSLEEAVAEFLSHKELVGVSDVHSSHMRAHLESLAGSFGQHDIRSVSGEVLLKWLLELKEGEGMSGRTVKNYFGSIKNFFNWCVRRKFIVISPAAQISVEDLPKVPRNPKEILSVEQCQLVMQWLERNAPEFVVWHALQFFAGIRNAEAGRIRRDSINLQEKTVTLEGWEIRVDGSLQRVVKTGDDWVLHDLPENLWPWLQRYLPADAQRSFAVPDENDTTTLRKRFVADLAPTLSCWPKNAMRHTFCTMLMSLHGDAAKVANWSRHTNARQLYQSYVAKLVSREIAASYCRILPSR
jgi:site-specific recombinase XerC